MIQSPSIPVHILSPSDRTDKSAAIYIAKRRHGDLLIIRLYHQSTDTGKSFTELFGRSQTFVIYIEWGKGGPHIFRRKENSFLCPPGTIDRRSDSQRYLSLIQRYSRYTATDNGPIYIHLGTSSFRQSLQQLLGNLVTYRTTFFSTTAGYPAKKIILSLLGSFPTFSAGR